MPKTPLKMLLVPSNPMMSVYSTGYIQQRYTYTAKWIETKNVGVLRSVDNMKIANTIDRTSWISHQVRCALMVM